MKTLRLLFTLVILAGSAFAWPSCSGQWVSVPKGTTGGTLYSTGDLLFQCQTPTPTPKPTDPSSTSSSTSSATSSASSQATASSSQGQKQQQNQSQTANGGQANATNQGNTTTISSSYSEVRQAPMAYAPDAIPSAPCRGGFSGGASSGYGGISFGGSKRDEECDLRETARSFALLGNQEAAAKVLCETKGAKKAKLTQVDCLKIVKPIPMVVSVPRESAPVTPSITINVPAPVVEPIRVVAEQPQVITVTAPATPKKRVTKSCPVTYKGDVKVIQEK